MRDLVRKFLEREATFAELRTEAAKPTLEELGTPWAECYGGTGRPTGRLDTTPTYCQDGDVAPGWRWVGAMTEAEFEAEFEYWQHFECHTPSRADFACPHCREVGWVD